MAYGLLLYGKPKKAHIMSAIDIFESCSDRIEDIVVSLRKSIKQIAKNHRRRTRAYRHPKATSEWELKLIKWRAKYHFHKGELKMHLGDAFFMHELFLEGEQEKMLGMLNLEPEGASPFKEITMEDLLTEEDEFVDKPIYRSTVKPSNN
jgi:hypothetical protein